MKIKTQFDIQQKVTLKTDVRKEEGIITNIQIKPKSERYCIMTGRSESWHYDFELEAIPDARPKAGFNK